MSEEDVLRAKTATLTRMLNLQGTIGMFGHVSIRVPGTDTCFISPGASTEKTTVRPEQIFDLQYRRHHHRASRRPHSAGMAHSYANPSRPARCHVRLPSARAACARARHRRQALEAGVSARLFSLHRRADLGQSAACGVGQPGRRPFARARQSSRGADARPRQRRRRRHARRRRFSPARSWKRTRKSSCRPRSWAAPFP